MQTFEEHAAQQARVAKRRHLNTKPKYVRQDWNHGRHDRRDRGYQAHMTRRLLEILRLDLAEGFSPVDDWDDSAADEWSAEIIQENWTTLDFYNLVDCLRYLDCVFEEDPARTLWNDAFILWIADHLDCLVSPDRRELQLLTFEQGRLYELIVALKAGILFGDDEIDEYAGQDTAQDWTHRPYAGQI